MRRRVIECSDGFAITDDPGGFTTTDRTLAEEVRRKLDQIDPLPCPGHGDFINLAMMSRRPEDWDGICGRCQRFVSAAERAAIGQQAA